MGSARVSQGEGFVDERPDRAGFEQGPDFMRERIGDRALLSYRSWSQR